MPHLKLFSLTIAECATHFGWSPRRAMEALRDLDFEVFPDLTIEHYGRIEDWEAKWLRLPDAGRILATDAGEVVGYWSFAPLTTEQREKFKAGTFFDTDMSARNLPELIPGKIQSIYFSAVVVRKAFRSSLALRVLYRSFFAQLTQLAQRNVFIDAIYANAFSPEGVRMCERAGAIKRSQHSDQGVIYELQLSPFPSSREFTSQPELKDLYSKKVGQRKV